MASQGKWGIWQSKLWYAVPNNNQYTWQEGAEYINIASPKGPEGKGGVLANDPRASGRTGITSASKDPVTAARFLNFLANEENNTRIRIGIEGVHYYMTEEGLAEFLPDYTDAEKDHWQQNPIEDKEVEEKRFNT